MASEIRVNKIKNRSGLGTITVSQDGYVVSGIVTANSFSGDISGSSTYADFTGGVGIGTVNGQVTFTGQTDVRKAGAASFVVGSSDAGGATIAIDGDSNGDGGGADYAFLTHDTDGDLQIVVDNPSNAGNIVFKTSSATPEKIRIKSDGTLFVRSGNATQGTNITGTSVGVGTTTTAGRNAGVGTANGTLVYNSTDNALQMYANDEWSVIQKKLPFSVSGGTVSNNVNRADFVTHTFTSPGNFVSAGQIVSAEVFVIGGGGGGGGRRYGGGGGAGGAMLATGVTLDPGTYGVAIGSGGNGGTESPATQGSDGGNTIFNPGGSQQRQGTGGGGGGGYDGGATGRNGGCGGGAGSRPNSNGGTSTQPSAPGTGTDYGNRGGNYGNHPNGWAPAGGGGTGAQGTDTPAQINGGGNGGDGVQLSISGTATYYGGGGGASAFHSISPDAPGGNTDAPANHKTFGGAGGGGTGASSPDVTPPTTCSPNQNATANTGSGGAGAHHASSNFSTSNGGNGAGGLVIVAYPLTDNSVTTS